MITTKILAILMVIIIFVVNIIALIDYLAEKQESEEIVCLAFITVLFDIIIGFLICRFIYLS